jgi:hypothetical protein
MTPVARVLEPAAASRPPAGRAAAPEPVAAVTGGATRPPAAVAAPGRWPGRQPRVRVGGRPEQRRAQPRARPIRWVAPWRQAKPGPWPALQSGPRRSARWRSWQEHGPRPATGPLAASATGGCLAARLAPAAAEPGAVPGSASSARALLPGSRPALQARSPGADPTLPARPGCGRLDKGSREVDEEGIGPRGTSDPLRRWANRHVKTGTSAGRLDAVSGSTLISPNAREVRHH